MRCSIVSRTAWLILLLKSISSSEALHTFKALFPLLLERITLNYSCIPCWTLNRHLLKLAAWVHVTVSSLADFSHLPKESPFWSENSSYHLAWDFTGLRNWSLSRPPASETMGERKLNQGDVQSTQFPA